MLCSRVSLVIYVIHSSVYISVLISQFISPLFPPWYPCICLFSISVTHFCFANEFLSTIFLESTYQWYYKYLFLSFCLLHSVWQSLGLPVLCKWHYSVIFYGWVIFHCMCVPHLLIPQLESFSCIYSMLYKPVWHAALKIHHSFPSVHCSTVYNSQDMKAT